MKATIQALKGNVPVHFKGTVQWSFEDDLGRRTSHLIPNTLYMPSVDECIFSPQHWSQALAANGDTTAQAITNATSTQLVWAHGEHVKTAPIDPISNVTTIMSCARPKLDLQAYPMVVSDSEDDDAEPPQCVSNNVETTEEQSQHQRPGSTTNAWKTNACQRRHARTRHRRHDQSESNINNSATRGTLYVSHAG